MLFEEIGDRILSTLAAAFIFEDRFNRPVEEAGNGEGQGQRYPISRFLLKTAMAHLLLADWDPT